MFSIFRKKIDEYKKLKYLAYHDTLTKVYNRNWLNENINGIKLKYVYFIDINNLRKINKNGHTFGDKYINKCIKSIILTNGDIIMRYAGDEFILFSNTKNKIKTGELFSVGMCEFKNKNSIHIADKRMIKSKLFLKINHRGINNAIL